MAIQPYHLPLLADLLVNYDYQQVKDRYLAAFNRLPETVITEGGTRRQAIWDLLTSSYKRGELKDYLAAMNGLADLDQKFRDILGLDKPCPTTARLIHQMAFIDRLELREKLVEFLPDEEGRSILTITGETATGKSHSGHLISHVARMRAGADPIWLKLSEITVASLGTGIASNATELEPYELMELIADHLRLTLRQELRTQRTQDPRIVQKLLTWFEGQFPTRPNAPQRVWLILDDLNFAACPAWMIDFVAGLCLRRVRGAFPGLSIFLIGFEKERLQGDAQALAEEECAVAPDRDHVWDFVTATLAEKGHFLEPSDKQQTLDGIWGAKPAPLSHQEIRAVAVRAAAFVRTLGA